MITMLSEFKCCWIAETGESRGGLLPDMTDFKFQYENLNILFRSASHISTLTRNNSERKEMLVFPFPSKPVRLPGCFTAAQRQIAVKYVDKIEDVLNVEEIEEFLGNGFTDRLVVVLSDGLPSDFSLKELKERWNATEVVYCSGSREIDCVSGSEFQSVLFIINCEKDAYIGEKHLTLVVSRAQYEVGIILIRTDQSWFERANLTVTSYLSVIRSDYAELFDQFISSSSSNITNSTITKWIQPTDTDRHQWAWWKKRMKIHLDHERERTLVCVQQQPISLQLQLYFAFYHLRHSMQLESSSNGKSDYKLSF